MASDHDCDCNCESGGEQDDFEDDGWNDGHQARASVQIMGENGMIGASVDGGDGESSEDVVEELQSFAKEMAEHMDSAEDDEEDAGDKTFH